MTHRPERSVQRELPQRGLGFGISP